MVVNPQRRSALVRAVFPSFKLGTIDLQFEPTFRYIDTLLLNLCEIMKIFIEKLRICLYAQIVWSANSASDPTVYLCMILHCGRNIL